MNLQDEEVLEAQDNCKTQLFWAFFILHEVIMRLTGIERLNIIRKRRGITLKKLSKATGLSVSYLGNVVSGNASKISKENRGKIAKVIGMPVETIFTKG